MKTSDALLIVSFLVLAATCCVPEDASHSAWQVDPEALAERLNERRTRPDGPHEWDNCDVERFGGIEPVHACTFPTDGYAPKCVWYPGKRLDNGEWAPLNAAAEGELGAVCVCNNSDYMEEQTCS